MSRRRIPIALAAPVALVLLVGALGALQYRWVGQVSAAERDQLRQSLDRRAREFADDFDRELTHAYRAFRLDGSSSPTEGDRFARQHAEWLSTSRFPGLIRTAYVVAPDDMLHRYDPDARAFVPAGWPEHLIPARARLASEHLRAAPSTTAGQHFVAFSTSPVMPEIPAVLITDVLRELPVATPIEMTRAEEMQTTARLRTPAPRQAVVLDLDAEYIASVVLPALAERHFPDAGADRYRVSVIDSSAAPVLGRGLAKGEVINPEQADATSAFFGGIVEVVRGVMTAATGASAGAMPRADWTAQTEPSAGRNAGSSASLSAVVISRPPTESNRVSMVLEQRTSSLTASTLRAAVPGAWTLRLQHQAGSLAAAVERARRRNLFLSFGILGVLVASVGLVMLNARRAERLAASQMDFVATVSHELRTPVAVIRSAAQNLSAGIIQDPAQAKRYGEVIETEGRRLTDMVEQVLEYAGLSGNRRPPAGRPVDAGALARDVVDAAVHAGAPDVEFDVRVDDDVPAVMADEEALRRALQNLVGNALKHGGDGGWVGVTVARGRGSDNGRVLLSVADRGAGIPAADLAHIFDPFYRGRHAIDRQVQGNGLGLSLVKRIAEAHGGRVAVASTPGDGATFTISLPAASGAGASAVVDASAVSLDRRAHSAGGGSA